MSDKQALLEFQARLAERLQAARSGDIAAGWLAVRAGTARLLIPLSHAAEIFPWTDLHRVPYVQPWFLGVANLRGGLFGVVDFARFVASTWPLGAGAVTRSEQALAETSLLSLNAALEVNAALLVDKLAGLRGADAFVSVEPQPAGTPDYFGKVFVDAQDQRWQEINLQTLSQYSPFLSISG